MMTAARWRFFQLPTVQLLVLVAIANGARESQTDITPIPPENLNPRITEFRRIDSNTDDHLTFTEFILADRPYIEAQSRRFHQFDANGDGRISRVEYESFYRDRDRDHRRVGDDVSAEINRQHRLHTSDFFKHLKGGLYDDPNDPRMHSNLAPPPMRSPAVSSVNHHHHHHPHLLHRVPQLVLSNFDGSGFPPSLSFSHSPSLRLQTPGGFVEVADKEPGESGGSNNNNPHSGGNNIAEGPPKRQQQSASNNGAADDSSSHRFKASDEGFD